MSVEIDLESVKKWKEESIKVAKEMNLFSDDIINDLKTVEIQLLPEPLPEDGNIIFGHAEGSGFYLDKSSNQLVFQKPKVCVYHKNHSSSFDEFFNLLKKKGVYSSKLDRMVRNCFTEKDLFEIYNQSGMDHELLGHIGSWLSGKKGDERDACIAQYQTAGYRGRESKKWEYATKFIPLFQEKHRKISPTEYKTII